MSVVHLACRILNKLTPEKFDKLSLELLNVGIDSQTVLKGIILLVRTLSSLPCDAMRCTVFVIVILSVRLSCHTRGVDWVHMVRPTIMISSPYGSPIILVSGDIKFIPKFEGDHPEQGRWMRVGWVRIGDFRPISRRISETVRDTTKVTINH